MSTSFATNLGSGGSPFSAEDLGGGTLVSRVKDGVGRDGTFADAWTAARLISAATTNATSLKASAGVLGILYACNLNAAVRYLKFYNKASAPTVGTDTPVLTIPIPASATGAGVTIPLGKGLDFSTGIAYATTTGVADADTAAVAANEILLTIGYV